MYKYEKCKLVPAFILILAMVFSYVSILSLPTTMASGSSFNAIINGSFDNDLSGWVVTIGNLADIYWYDSEYPQYGVARGETAIGRKVTGYGYISQNFSVENSVSSAMLSLKWRKWSNDVLKHNIGVELKAPDGQIKYSWLDTIKVKGVGSWMTLTENVTPYMNQLGTWTIKLFWDLATPAKSGNWQVGADWDDVSLVIGYTPPPPPPPPGEEGEITIEVTESVFPELNNPNIEDTIDAWVRLIENAQHTIDIEAFFMYPPEENSLQRFYNALLDAAENRGVEVRILVHAESYNDPRFNEWFKELDNYPTITVLPFLENEFLHSKYIIIDNVVSVGSTNWHDRGLTRNREVNLTLSGENIAGSFTYIFESGWVAAGGTARGSVYWENKNWIFPVCHGPKIPENVTLTIDGLVQLLDNAVDNVQVYVYIYAGGPYQVRDALFRAANRGVWIDFMVAKRCYDAWSYYLENLAKHPNIYVKYTDFENTDNENKDASSHVKFMTVDGQWTWVGSANWHPQWMQPIGGGREVGVAVKSTEVVETLVDNIFYIDWYSKYTRWVGSPYLVAVDVTPFRNWALPGENVEFTVTVTNSGRHEIDNYNLSTSDAKGWQMSISPSVLENLSPGHSAQATLNVTIPENATPGNSNKVTVTATSQGDNTVGASASVLALVADVTQLSPDNDAAVFQDLPSSNYGSENWLELASKIGSNRRSYLKFNLSQLTENALLLNADLNLYFYWGSGFTTLRDAGVLIEARAVRNDSWSESTITWNNAPAIEELINTSTIGSYGWKVWGVGSFAKQQFENDKLASFAIKFSVENFDENLRRIRFRSKEALDNRPYLKVKYFPATYSLGVEASPSQKYIPAGWKASYYINVMNLGNIDDNYQLSPSSSLGWPIEISPSVLENVFPGETETALLTVTVPDNAIPGTVDTATVTATSLTKSTAQGSAQALTKVVETLELSPTDDSYVNQENADLNYGSATYLEVASKIGGSRRAYLKFNVSTVPENVEIVSSRIYAYFYWGEYYDALRDENVLIEARAVRNDNWGESTITWNNAPAIENLLESVNIGTWKRWKWWNIDNYMLEQYGGDKVVSAALRFSVENFDENLHRIRFKSKENAEFKPYLSIWYFPANVVYGVDVQVEPKAKGGSAGDNLLFTVKVTNTGNIKDSFDLSAQSALGWSVSLNPTNLEKVPPNTTATATLTVTIPSNAQPGQVDNITVKATSRGDNAVSDNAVARAGISQTSTLLSTGDAAIFQGTPNSNYGSEVWLEVASAVDNNRRSLLKFDLSSLPAGSEVIGADLNLYFYWGSGFTTLRDASVLIEARAILNDNWSESTVTWNNAPALGDLLNAVEIGSYGWKVWKVGDFVAQQFQGDKLASFAIKFSVESFDSTLRRIRFRSEEYADNLDQRPYLKVEYFP